MPVMSDRRCRAGSLDNPVRRLFFPASRELDPLGITEGQRVVDVGAGVGFLAPEVLRRIGPAGCLYLVEPDEANLAIAKRRCGLDARVGFSSESSAHMDSIPPGTIDRILLSLVLCCVVDKEATMAEAWRVLTPGGRALVSYPRFPSLPRRGRLSLRISPLGWGRLVSRFPWTIVSTTGRLIRRHVLEKPA
ncbi:MAG TPA: methyltransferase domain-containing protein, partial [Thermoplasmata archaeon]|nr:methyltransferase domain-containing protein [Thermoplasmata archaeon]